jgi:hypothetical protein
MSEETKLEKLEEYFAAKRQDWSTKIRDIVYKLRDVKQLDEAIVLMLSYRQMILESLTELSIKGKKAEAAFQNQHRIKYMGYYNNDYKFTDKQKDSMAKTDLIEKRKQIDLFDSQIEFYRESIKTLDNMGWAIKSRISVEQM